MKAALSIALQDLRGKSGAVVISRARSGLVVKPRIAGANPRTDSQQSVRSNFARANEAYMNLDPEQVAAWRAYAETLTKINPVGGECYRPSANTVFVGLATKFLQVSPNGAIPSVPPNAPFQGGSISVTATSLAGDKIRFAASAQCAPEIVTELLLLRLPSRNRKPFARNFRTVGFANWSSGLTRDVQVTPGYYAPACRFVQTATGQSTALQILDTVEVMPA